MKGRIINLEGEAKLEIWAEAPSERDLGGFCHKCEKYFYSMRELIRHFVKEHEHESKIIEGTGMATALASAMKSLEMQKEG